MERLVYSPKVYCYTKNQSGTLYNLTNYVVSGQVQRLINQVSSAEVTLRNPGRIFTGGQGQDRAFHPMDPITIYLERVSGYPVRVFTGYLDTTPYYQMYPGTITLKASCTLKKLLYTFFDPSLPYVIAFFEKYGWVNTGSGSIISTQAFGNRGVGQGNAQNGAQPFENLLDGSIGKLLWAILYDIGEWQDSNIYVENLPSGQNGIASRMTALMNSMNKAQQQGSEEFQTFLQQIIGQGSYGSGGTGLGTPSNPVGGGNVTSSLLNRNQQVFGSIVSQNTGLDPNVVAAWIHSEEPASSSSAPNGANNWLNIGSTDSGYIGGSNSFWNDPQSAGAFTAQWIQGKPEPGYGTASAGIQAIMSTAGQSPQAQIAAIQGSGWASSGYPNLPAVYQAVLNSPGVSQPSTTKSPYGTATTNKNVSAADSWQQIQASTGTKAAPTTSNALQIGTLAGVAEIALAAAAKQSKDHVYTYTQQSPGRTNDGNYVLSSPYSFDCSGFVGACYRDAGLPDPSGNTNYTGNSYNMAASSTNRQVTAAEAVPGDMVVFPDHVVIYIGNGQCVSMGGQGEPAIQTIQAEASYNNRGITGYYHMKGAAPGNAAAIVNNPTGLGSTPGAGAASSVSSQNTAQAFVAELQFPSVEDQVTAIALGAEHKGLMHDQSLMPFVQQVAQASLRSFQSLPNGDFYAFYPDYFGEMGHHKPYWMIDDIEILSGGIDLTDDALATHVFAVGDNTWPVNNELMNMLFSAGTINVFNAFVSTGIIDTSVQTGVSNKKGKQANPNYNGGLDPGMMTADEAVKFIERYGARPLVKNYPMVRSPIFEMLLAYQQFMLAWSNQFKTPFTFTFMPEIFPGGKVGFPQHGIQMYVNSVTHQWDYTEAGFTTTVELSAPSLLDGVNSSDFPDLPPFMVQAMIEPVKAITQNPTANESWQQIQAQAAQTTQGQQAPQLSWQQIQSLY